MDLFESMREKFSWGVSRVVLKGSGFPVRRGWDDTIKSLRELDQLDDFEGRKESCIASYKEALLCIDKTVRIYKVSEEDRNVVDRAGESAVVEDTAFSRQYPFCLDSVELSEEISDVVKLVAIEKNDAGIAYVFSSKIYTKLRETYDGNAMSPDIVRFFKGADEIIAITNEAKQLFHVAWVPKDKDYVEIRVDTPRGIPAEKIAAMHRAIRLQFNEIVGCHALKNSVNLFSCVRNLYHATDDGSVVEMTFATQTASIKNEKMRKSELDLRVESFHVGGCEAVEDNIDPYKIAVRWEKERSGYKIFPEIELNGSLRNSQSDSPHLSEFKATNATCVEDYEFLVGKVFKNR